MDTSASSSSDHDKEIKTKSLDIFEQCEHTRSLNILLAEDTEINQKLALKFLTKLGHKVALAQTGTEALKLFSAAMLKVPFDLVIMDCRMPEIDGYSCTKQIRELEANIGIHTPIIAWTAYALEGDREKCLASGMDEYIAKPADIRKIASIIAQFSTHSLQLPAMQ